MTEHFLVVYAPGPAWIPDRPFHEQSLLGHGSYVHRLFKAGILLEGGPFTDSTGGMVLIAVENRGQAEDILSKDPAILEGVFTATLHPWMRVNWAEFGQ